MKPIKILGIGSPFGEDQIGWKVIESLKTKINPKDKIYKMVSINSFDRPGIRLLELIQDAEIVYIVDAMKSGGKLGDIYRYENKAIFKLQKKISTHSIGVIDALMLGNELGSLPKTIILYGIEIKNSKFVTDISKSLDRTINKVTKLIIEEISKLS